jgi:predicted restriction endonuclease
MICPICNIDFEPKSYRIKFCSRKCSGINSNRNRLPPSKETKAKISESIKRLRQNNPDKYPTKDKLSKLVGKGTKGKYKDPSHLYELSTRTLHKVMQRMMSGCLICGWNEASCDIHHLKGRKIQNPHHISNLTYLCPNHHRLCHNKKIDIKSIKTIEEYLEGKNWKDFYFG